MKNVFFSFAILLICSLGAIANPDEKYIKAMEGTLTQLNAAKTIDELQQVANKFEMIGKAAATEWLPGYYASYCYIMLSFMEKDSDKRDKYIEKADALLKNLAENDEVLVMKAFSANASLAIDGQNRWMKQGPIFDENLKNAEKLNAENPRIYFLRGNNIFHTPAAFGGGAKNACPFLQKAKEKFDAFKSSSTISPIWGKESTTKLLESCK